MGGRRSRVTLPCLEGVSRTVSGNRISLWTYFVRTRFKHPGDGDRRNGGCLVWVAVPPFWTVAHKRFPRVTSPDIRVQNRVKLVVQCCLLGNSVQQPSFFLVILFFPWRRCSCFGGLANILTAVRLRGLKGGDSVVPAAVTLPSSSSLTPRSVSPSPHPV